MDPNQTEPDQTRPNSAKLVTSPSELSSEFPSVQFSSVVVIYCSHSRKRYSKQEEVAEFFPFLSLSHSHWLPITLFDWLLIINFACSYLSLIRTLALVCSFRETTISVVVVSQRNIKLSTRGSVCSIFFTIYAIYSYEKWEIELNSHWFNRNEAIERHTLVEYNS